MFPRSGLRIGEALRLRWGGDVDYKSSRRRLHKDDRLLPLGRPIRCQAWRFEQAEPAAARAALEASYAAMVGRQPREPRTRPSRAVVALLVAGESGPVAR